MNANPSAVTLYSAVFDCSKWSLVL